MPPPPLWPSMLVLLPIKCSVYNNSFLPPHPIATLTPFVLNFRSDSYEQNAEEDSGLDRGFQLGFTMDAINC